MDILVKILEMYGEGFYFVFHLGFWNAVIAVVLYFIPYFIALARHNRKTSGFFFLNLLFNWTIVGYVINIIVSLAARSN